MKLKGTRFSTIEYEADDIITVVDGLIGFPDSTHYVLVCPKPDSPFRWLQSIEEPPLAFLVVDPVTYFPEYLPDMSQSLARDLEISEETPQMVYCTVSIPAGSPQDMTVNLLAPLVINASKRIASQTVVENAAYTMRHRVFPEANRVSETAAA
jgi:flagellar assembly factor FliW